MFFSSKRRHTISKLDWSSDVCSSNLGSGFTNDKGPFGAFILETRNTGKELWLRFIHQPHDQIGRRRVGKECRSRWSQYHYKNKTRVPVDCLSCTYFRLCYKLL